MIDILKSTIDREAPAVTYIHVPFEYDEQYTPGYERLLSFADEQMKSGNTCIIADTRHSSRWYDRDPVLCRGDLAFYCNDTQIANELVEWAESNDIGNPRSVDDLNEPEFADMLSGIAESHHLDKNKGSSVQIQRKPV